MSIMVKKFGGSSVANIERIEVVAEKIFQFYQKKQQVVVVVSAMQGETDKLESLAYQITPDPDSREMAALLATGEQLTISLLCIALIKRGCPARSYTGLQLGIQTDGAGFNKSRVKNIDPNKIYQDLQAGMVVVVAGFQGVDIEGNITTLGRGGSDTTAVALAAVLQAKECHIYTDVDGVYTADPNIEPNAKKLDSIDFSEMLELSGLGAKVMQIRAIELGGYYNMPIRVLSSFNQKDNAGTLIAECKNNLDYQQVAKIATLRKQIKIFVQKIEHKNILLILKNLADSHIEFDMLTNHDNVLSFTISSKYLDQCKSIVNGLIGQKDIANYIQVAKLSLVGLGLNSNPELIAKVYSSLYQEDIVIQQVITSEIKVSILLNETDLELAIKILHKAFSLMPMDSFIKEEELGRN
ncbi:MAG: aspartate kinase [Gammaproteobacteria bacterium]